MKRTACLAFAVSIMSGVAQAAQPSPCSSPEHREFDFWVGRWDVFETQSGKPAGHSLVERLYDGCALRENWSEPGFTGGSLNHYSTEDGRWRQTWTDSTGAWREFVGGLEDGRMVLIWRLPSTGAGAGEVQVRMTFTPEAGGEVRQYSDVSRDGGRTWRLRYDYIYRPARGGS
jgi:hypothetical protein